MCKKVTGTKARQAYKAKRGKGGFTLVELCVVLALLAILTTMVVSFSILMNGSAAENKSEYEYLEDHATLKEVLCTWAAENDVTGSVFSVSREGRLTVIVNGENKAVSFADGILSLGAEQRSGFDTIDAVTITSDGKLVKCSTYRLAKNGVWVKDSFVFSLRCGTIDTGEVIGND